MRYLNEHRECRGLTLAEMMVVCAVICLIASILLPGLRGARQVARSVKCASNLWQWGEAQQVYGHDNRGYITERGQGQMPMTGGVNVYVGNYWYNALPPLIGGDSFSTMYDGYRMIRPGQADAGAAVGKIWLCPDAADDHPENRAFFSYGQNMGLSPTISGRPDRISMIGVPSSMVLMTDSTSQHCSVWPTIELLPKDYNPAARHRNMANVMFADGHVSRYGLSDSGMNANPMTSQQEGDEVRWKTPVNVWAGPTLPLR